MTVLKRSGGWEIFCNVHANSSQDVAKSRDFVIFIVLQRILYVCCFCVNFLQPVSNWESTLSNLYDCGTTIIRKVFNLIKLLWFSYVILILGTTSYFLTTHKLIFWYLLFMLITCYNNKLITNVYVTYTVHVRIATSYTC